VPHGAAALPEATAPGLNGVGGRAGSRPLIIPGTVQGVGDVAGVGSDGGLDLIKLFGGVVGAQPGGLVGGLQRRDRGVSFGGDGDDLPELVAQLPVVGELVDTVLFDGPGVVQFGERLGQGPAWG
jgi:hypothetical protein